MHKQALSIQLKRLGKKKIKTLDYHINSVPSDLMALLKVCVEAEVQRYNEARNDQRHSMIDFLSAEQIKQQSQTGKVAFNDPANATLADPTQALDNVIQGYKDGLFVVFVDEQEIIDLKHPLNLEPESIITFIRMTFLTGTHW